eukprot:1121607-Rhodomonas_salina.3
MRAGPCSGPGAEPACPLPPQSFFHQSVFHCSLPPAVTVASLHTASSPLADPHHADLLSSLRGNLALISAWLVRTAPAYCSARILTWI